MSKELISKLFEGRDAKQARLDEITAAAEKRDNIAYTDEERTEVTALVAELPDIDKRITELVETEKRKDAAAETRKALGLGSETEQRFHVGGERTYRKGATTSYYRDLYLRQKGDFDAAERLKRHAQEVEVESRKDGTFESRAMNRTDGTGGTFVPPSYLIDEYAALARAGRPFANSVRHFDLPPGTDSINVPKVTQGTLVGAQNGDAGALAQQDINDTYVTVPVVTIAGQARLSLQLIEQSPIAFDEMVFGDLQADYNRLLDTHAWSGSGSSGQVQGTLGTSGISAVTYTSGSPTVPALYSKIADATQRVHTLRFREPTAHWMHPRRWAWILSSADSANRPLVVPSSQGPNNALATQDGVHSEGVAGTLGGLPVKLDANMPTNLGAGTNEDRIATVREDDLWLFESALRSRVLEQTKGDTLEVLLQVYAYVGYTAARYPTSVSVISGTGLIAPTF